MNLEEELVSIYPWLLATAKQYCQSIQDAEDLVGDTIYKVLLNKSRFDEKKSLKPWCKVIMLNTYITIYNRRNLALFVSYDQAKEVPVISHSSDRVSLREVFAMIRMCARRSCCIECVLLCAKGYSYIEISELFHIPVGTVRSRIALGRQMIKDVLDDKRRFG